MINIINHIEENHIDGISTHCGLCGQVFRTRAALQKHKTSRPDICHEYHEYHEYHESYSWRNFSFPCMNYGEIENFSTCGDISDVST